MPITWLNAFNTNIATVDQQHKKLVEMINNLEKAKGDENEIKIIGEIFYQLVDYTKYHFSYEENLMSSSSYPKLNEHFNQHKELVSQIVEMLEILKSGELIQNEKLTNILKDWLIQHILGYDKEFGQYYKNAMQSDN